jgi:CRP/FNR family transcriptional regulator
MKLPLKFADYDLMEAIEKAGQLRHIDANAVIMQPGDLLEFVPIVISGSIRVLLQNENGDEHYLYHIFPGETCAMSLSCCQANKRSEIKAVAEEDTEIWFIPVRFVDEWTRFPEWKKYLSDIQAQRFSELLEAIELMAFSHLDEQLWNYLVKRVQATGSKTLHVTHQEIANELHSPREVITRLLHQLQKQSKLTLSRGAIEIISVM